MLRLCQEFQCKDARLLINRMELGDIQRVRGGRFNMGGAGSNVLRVYNVASNLLSSAADGILSGNATCPWRYWAWQRVGHCRSCVLIVKWSDV